MGYISKLNLEILQRFQLKILRMIVNAPWYVTNERLNWELDILIVRQEIKARAVLYKERMQTHPN